jgi:hypothetical protein
MQELFLINKTWDFEEGVFNAYPIAKGENIVLLNNDTVVTVGWLTRLLWWLNMMIQLVRYKKR